MHIGEGHRTRNFVALGSPVAGRGSAVELARMEHGLDGV